MAQEPPAWLDKTFLVSVVQGEDENQVTIVKFSASPAVAAGNNYMSQLFRVRVEYTVAGSDLQTISLIIKIPISKGVITEVLNSSDLHAKEPRIYRELLPILNKLANCEFAPTFLNCPITNVMILKDMKEEGYIMCDKYKLLDYSHCKHVILSLAKLHASSVACYHNNPELVEELGEERFFTAENEISSLWIKSCMKTVGGIFSEMDGCEQAAGLFSSKIESVVELTVHLYKPKTKGLNVLNHGDLWVNNMLFKHSDSGEVEDVKFIDFQVARWGSPAPDLLYFMWTSADEQVREHKQRELYSLYLQTLNSCLEQLHCPERLSERELEDDLRAASDFVLLIISGTLPYIFCNEDEAVSMEDVNAEDFKTGKYEEIVAKLFNSKRFKAALPIIMEQFQTWSSFVKL